MRDEFAACPRCTTALDARGTRRVCMRCEGVLMAEPELATLLAELAQTPFAAVPFEAYAGTEQALTCPCCPARMSKHALHGLTVDRCELHGVWFDGQELAGVIKTAELAHHPSIAHSRTHKVVTGVSFTAMLAFEIIRFVYF